MFLNLAFQVAQPFRAFQRFLYTGGWHNGDAILVADDPVSRTHDRASALHRDAGFAPVLSASGVGNCGARINRQRIAADLRHVADSAVDYNPSQAFESSADSRNSPPERRIQFPLTINH